MLGVLLICYHPLSDRLTAGSRELSDDLATHCVLELPTETGEVPPNPVDIETVSDDESRLFYQPLNGGRDVVFNALEREAATLSTWHRFQINS